MSSYCYLKAKPKPTRSFAKNQLLSSSLILSGSLIVVIVLGSFGFYEFTARQKFRRPQKVLGRQTQYVNPRPLAAPDFTRAENWFPNAPQLPPQQSQITHYNLSIPVLNIHQAVVEIGGEDLGKSMVHYPGTAYPGQKGNAVLFCHSVLPQFFNPQNYKTICSTLPTIDLGEKIIVNFDSVEYTYQIFDMFEVDPRDISVLNQDQSAEYLTMITCVPPGTYLRRLVVNARLI